jgi:transposase
MLVELRVAEQRYRAVWEVLEGASVTEVARRFKVSRQSVHALLNRYAADGGLGGLGDRSSRPHGCPHQMSPVTEAKIVEVRRSHPAWGADRIRYQLIKEELPAPGRTGIYRALIRSGLVVPGQRRRRRSDYRRWERARPMQLWQMDVVGGFHLADGTELKAVSGIDDSSRFMVSANDRAMTSSLDGSASSKSSTDNVTSRTRVRAVKVTESNVMSAAVIAAFSDFQAGDPSPVNRASFNVCAVIGTVTAPA